MRLRHVRTINWIAIHQRQSASIEVSPPRHGRGDFSLDGLVKDAIETLDERRRIFEWDAFEEEGLVEE
jgi:hypothetical protein